MSTVLKDAGVAVTTVAKPDEEAYAARNLVGIAWELKGGKADIVIDADGDVAAIRQK